MVQFFFVIVAGLVAVACVMTVLILVTNRFGCHNRIIIKTEKGEYICGWAETGYTRAAVFVLKKKLGIWIKVYEYDAGYRSALEECPPEHAIELYRKACSRYEKYIITHVEPWKRIKQQKGGE